MEDVATPTPRHARLPTANPLHSSTRSGGSGSDTGRTTNSAGSMAQADPAQRRLFVGRLDTAVMEITTADTTTVTMQRNSIVRRRLPRGPPK